MTSQLQIVEVPTMKSLINAAPGFEKKGLAEFKLDVCALCEFGCAYCSSNHGSYLRIRRKTFAALTEQQTGRRSLPAENPDLMFVWPDVLAQLESELSRREKTWGDGQTLVYSMLTDGFSPRLVSEGITERALRLLLDRTSFRIRVLTKNAIVGASRWVRFFQQFPGRFVVGPTIGTLDDHWARRVERKTPAPSARVRALHRLQDAGIPTYGMLCPVFPEALRGDHLDRLIDAIRPELVEHVWAEPYNDRRNWRYVRDCYDHGSDGYRWLTEVYGAGRKDLWSAYATELYVRLRDKAIAENWIEKLNYLLYEGDIVERDAPRFAGLDGVLLQSEPGPDGLSQNAGIASCQSVPVS